MSTYYTKLQFKGKYMEVGIKPLDTDGYDIELRSKERISGDEFQALRHYLEEEGYLDAARKYVFHQD